MAKKTPPDKSSPLGANPFTVKGHDIGKKESKLFGMLLSNPIPFPWPEVYEFAFDPFLYEATEDCITKCVAAINVAYEEMEVGKNARDGKVIITGRKPRRELLDRLAQEKGMTLTPPEPVQTGEENTSTAIEKLLSC